MGWINSSRRTGITPWMLIDLIQTREYYLHRNSPVSDLITRTTTYTDIAHNHTVDEDEDSAASAMSLLEIMHAPVMDTDEQDLTEDLAAWFSVSPSVSQPASLINSTTPPQPLRLKIEEVVDLERVKLKQKELIISIEENDQEWTTESFFHDFC